MESVSGPKLNVFEMARERMAHAAQTVTIASRNIANQHIPGYKSLEVQPLDFGKFLKASPAVTHPAHLGSSAKNAVRIREKPNEAENFSGNSVSEAEELQTVNGANLVHKQMTHLLQAYMEMFNMALNLKR